MKLSSRATFVRLIVAAVVGVVLFVAMSNVIENPIRDDARGLVAEFSDVSGLHEGADVRIRGVQVGKVEGVELRRQDGRSIGVVEFSLADRYWLNRDAKLAIKYQALTGLRYLDVADAVDGVDATADEITSIPLSMTTPSFDITSLFNGLQPVLSTLSPEEINTFTSNAVALLEGDGNGLGPMLDSIRKLTEFVSDRQAVVSTLMSNLSTVADTLGGKSPQLIQILDWLHRPIDAALAVLDEFRKSDAYGPRFVRAVVEVLDNLGLQRGLDVDGLLASAFSSVGAAAEAMRELPAVLDALSVPPAPMDGSTTACTNGHAELPVPVSVLLNGQKVTLCNPV